MARALLPLCCLSNDTKGKGEGFPYSIPSVGPGADLGVQAVSPQVTVRAKFHYTSWFEAGRRQVRSQISLHYLVRS